MEHGTRIYSWPDNKKQSKSSQTTAIVVINYNTKQLIIQLIWSLYNFLKPADFVKLMIVDNDSSDGSQQVLRKLSEEKMISYIENKKNLYHGPALNQAFDALSKAQQDKGSQVNAIWVLDSDCVILKPDTLVVAIKIMNENQAALVGQPVVDKWNNGAFGLHSLLVDPQQIWKDPIAPFEEHGQPSQHLQESRIQARLKVAPFNFTSEDYVIHLGRSTLAAIVNKKEKENRYFEWATKNSVPHFAGEPNAKENYEAFQKKFYQAVPNFEIETVVNAIKQIAK